jgi:hypothetical protein
MQRPLLSSHLALVHGGLQIPPRLYMVILKSDNKHFFLLCYSDRSLGLHKVSTASYKLDKHFFAVIVCSHLVFLYWMPSGLQLHLHSA